MPDDLVIEGLNDSKKLSEKKREALYDIIIENAISYSIAFGTLEEIEERELKEMLYTYLPKSQADVLWAVAMENVPLTELALREGVSKQAIFNRLTAARKNAKKLFQGG